MSETCSRVRVGKNLSNMFPIRNGLKEGDALSPLLFNFTLEYAIRRVHVNQDGLKLNGTNRIFFTYLYLDNTTGMTHLKIGTHQLLAYADDVNKLGGSVHTVKENAETLLVATRSKC